MPAVSMHKKLPPAQWRDEITLWLESLTAAGLSQDTINTRRCKIGHAARCLDKSPYDVTSEDLVHWTASQSWKAETRKGYRNTLVGFFRWLHATGRRADDPAVALPKVRKTRPHPRPCPDAHIYAAMCAANDVERLMLRLGAEAGLRLSEIAAVHSRDVLEGDAGPSLIVRGKGDKQRIVPISEDLAKRITAAPGWLFPGRWRGHVEKSYVSRHLTRLLPDGWEPHSLRHRYATRMYETTHDLLLVSKLLGHSSVETTQIYVAMPDSRLRVGLDAVTLAG